METVTARVLFMCQNLPCAGLLIIITFFENSRRMWLTTSGRSLGRAHPRVSQYSHLFTVVCIYKRVQWQPGLLGVPPNVSVMLPPTLTMKVRKFSCLSSFLPTNPWSWLPVNLMRLFKRKTWLLPLLWLLTSSKTPWMTYRFNQLDPVRVARSDAKMVLFRTTFPSLLSKSSFSYSSSKPFGNKQCSLGGLTACFNHHFSCFTLAAISLKAWIFSKVSTADLLKVPSKQKIPLHLPAVSKCSMLLQLDFEGIYVTVVKSVTCLGVFTW